MAKINIFDQYFLDFSSLYCYNHLMNWWVLKRKVHSSWLVAWLASGFIIGVYFAQFFSVDFWVIFFCFIATALVFYKRFVVLVPLIILSGVFLGQIRGGQVLLELNSFDRYVEESIVVSGKVSNDATTSLSNVKSFELGDLRIDGKKYIGQIYITAEIDDIRRGDFVALSGVLKPGFGKFVGIIHQAKLIDYQKISNSGRDFRDYFSSLVRDVLPKDEADLGLGYLLGEKSNLSADFVTALQLAGLTHIVVASGYNLTILVRIARRLFVKFSKYLALLTSLIMIFCFISITGYGPSMVRAGIVSVLSLLAWYCGRKIHPIVLLLIVAAATLIYNPSYLWFDIGWQLSFMAFAGVMILAPLMTRYFFEKSKIGFIPQLLIETVSAQIATLPILIVSFGQISNVALIANLMVLPFVPLAMLLVFMSGVLSAVLPAVAWIVSAPTTWLLGYMISIVGFFSELPWAVTKVELGWQVGGIMYSVVVLVCVYLWFKTKYNLREVNIVE